MAEPENPFLARARLLEEQGRLEQEAAASAATEAAAAPPLVPTAPPIAPAASALSATASPNPFADRAQQLYTQGQLSPVQQALSGTMGARLGPTTARAELQGPTRMGPTVENAQWLSILNGANQFLAENATPEVVAEVRRIARETGDSLPLAAQTYVERAALAERDRGAALLAANPALAALVDRRGYADLARDLDGLAAVEQVAESTLGRFILSPASLERIASDTAPATDLGFLAGSMARMERFLLSAASSPAYVQMTSLLTDVSQIGMSADEIYASMVSARGVPEAMLPAWTLANIRIAAQMQADRLAQYTEADIPDMMERAAEDLTRVSQLQELGRRLGQSAGTTRFTAELDAGPDEIGAFFEAAFRNPVDAGQFIAETIIESAPILVAGIVTGGLTGSVTVGSLTSGGASFSLENVNSAMEYLAEQGYQIRDIDDARQVLGNTELMAEAERRGLARGLIIGALDTLSGGIAGATLGRTPLGDLAAQTVVQGTFAGGGEILGSLAATGTYSPQAALLEALADVGTTPIEVAGIGLRSLGSARRQEQTLTELLGELPTTAQARAEAAAEGLETARAAIEETATFDRDPEAVRELLVEAGDQEVSVPTAEIDRLYQEGVLTDEDIEYLQIMEEMTAEGELSGEVAVPASRVLTLPGDGFGALVEHVRPAPSEPTLAEAREAVANRDADIERLEGVLAQAEAAVGEVNTLADTIFRQVRATQTVGRGPARALGRLLAERYAARAALFEGVTATQLYEDDQVTFAGPGTPPSAPVPTVEQAAAAMQQTPEFQQWFGSSAVVDEGGAPLVVYHGSRSAIGEDFAFDPARIGSENDAGYFGAGFYFSPFFEEALTYSGPQTTGPAVAEVYLSIQNPFIWNQGAGAADTQARLDELFGVGVISAQGTLQGVVDAAAATEAFKAAGYDGVMVYPEDGADVVPTEVVAFSPEQVKAITNEAPTSAPGIFEQAARDEQGRPVIDGQSSGDANVHGLMPHLLVDAGGSRDGKPLLLAKTKNSNAEAQIQGIDELLARHPDPLSSAEAWNAMMADALATDTIPAPPYAMIRDVNGDGAAELLGGMSEGQIADADHGFANAADFREMYVNGEVTPVGTAKLFMWSFLSRGVSPYTQEALFIDGFTGVDAFIELAAEGAFDYETTRLPFTIFGDKAQAVSLQLYKNALASYEQLPAAQQRRARKPQRKDPAFAIETGPDGLLLTYPQWAKLSAPKGSGQPGAGASHNLNAFGKAFLSRMSQDAGKGDGRSRLQVLHDMMSDPTSTGKEVRREFLRMGESVGIDNKVVSFTLLVAGYNDVLVLDRVQMRQMWNDGRFDGINLYDGYKSGGSVVTGSALSSITYGARGLLIYEAMERSLQSRIADVYDALGRPEAASVGRYHWETWVASSNQEASHGSIDAIISQIRGEDAPLSGVTAKEGEYGSYAYGARYGRDGAGGTPYFLYEVPGRGLYEFSVPAFSQFMTEIKKPKNGVVPTGFKVTEEFNGPWYNRPEASLDALDAAARANGGAAVEAEIVRGNDVEDGRDQGVSNRPAADQLDTTFEQEQLGPDRAATTQERTDGQGQDRTAQSLYERGIGPSPAQLRAEGRSRGTERAEDQADTGTDDAVTDQLVDAEALARFNDDAAFGEEFLSRPGWGVVTATTDPSDFVTSKPDGPVKDALLAAHAERVARDNASLRDRLDSEGIPYLELQGVYKGIPDGTSFLILADEDTVRGLGVAYNQESILTRDGLTFSQPQARVEATGEVATGEVAAQSDFYSILPSGLTFSMGLDLENSGRGAVRIPDGYTESASRPQLPIRPDGYVELHHWSGERRSSVDPAFAGSGPLQGAERASGARWSFYGINPKATVQDQGTGYVKEAGLGAVEHVAFVQPEQLYPWFEDPDGLVDGKDEVAAAAAIREAGYVGHYVTEDGSGRAPLGNVAVLYEAAPVVAVADEIGPLEQPITEGPQTETKGAVGAPRGSYRLPTNDDPRNIINLTANSDPSTLVHEVGHMFLFQMTRDLQDARLTEDGRAQLEQQITATKAWFASNAEQAFGDLKKLAADARKRAKADPDNTALQQRAARLEAAVGRAGKGQRAVEYMQGVANAFLDPEAQGYDEAAEIVFHELWARGFEKYIGTGSAPSEGLRTAFAKFAKYITSVYTSLRRLNVEVSPEVADVFDRLLATEDALNSERRGSLYQISPGVLDGATPTEARELRRLAAEAEDEARTQMLRREENALRKAAREQRAARREELTEQYTEEVAAEPVYAATEIVRTGALLDGTPTGTGKIARAEVIAVAGPEAADQISSTVISGRNAPDNAMPLGELAMLSGFPDVTSLVDALADPETRPMADEVSARVEAQLQTEFGAETDPAALQEQAVEAVQNERFQKLQQLQLRILRRLAAEPLARVSRRQAEQVGAPAPAVDQAAEDAAQAAQGAARTSAEAVQANLQRIKAQVQRQANAGQRRAQAAAGRQTRGIQRNIDPAAITEAARRYVSGMKVQKATPARYKQAAARLTIKIERAIAARNYTEAASLMEQRALNLAVSQEAARVQTMIKAKRARWRTLTARSDKRLSANYDMAWVNAIRVALEPLGLARASRTNYSAADALADLQQVEPALYADILQQIDAVGRDAQVAAQADPKDPVRALTVERVTEIFDLADQLLANARNSHGLLVDGRRVEFGKIAAEVSTKVDNRRDVARRQRRAERRGDRRLSRSAEMFADRVSGFAAGLRRIEIWARDMDNGDPRGPMTRYLVRPVMQAVDRYNEARLDPLKRLGALLKDQKGLLRNQPIKADELAPGWSFRNKGELLMALLNTGNPSNMRKLLMGGGSVNGRWSSWTSTQDSSTDLDTSRWDAFIARAFADGTLTKADMDAVQGIWDIFESTKPQAQAAHQKMFGYRFVEVPSQDVVTPVGTYRGGYVPAVLDRLTSPNSDKFDAQEAMSQQSNASMFPGAEKGFTVARTDATYVLDLDITRLPMHFDRVMKFTHLGPAVQQAARLVNNDEFRAQVDRVNSNSTPAAIIPWLQRTVRQQVATPATNAKGHRLLERAASTLDRRVGMHIMAANIKNAVEQLTGFFPALARMPAKHLIAAGTTWKYNGESARRHMLEVSPFMRQRIEIGANETLNLIDNIMREPGLLAKTQDAAVRYSYFAQQLVANAMEPTIWLAAERQAMETVYPKAYADALSRTGNDTEADAEAKAEVYAYADEVVRSTQGSTRPSDVSGIEGSTALMRIFLRFYSFFNTQGNAFVAERNIARNSDMGWAGRTGRAFYAYAMILAVPAILSKLLSTALSGELDELEDEELLPMAATVLLGSQVEMVAGTVPFIGQAVSIPYGRLFTDTPFDDGMRGSAGLSVASRAGMDVVDLIADIVDSETDVETAEGLRVTLNATGLLIGLPTNWLNKPLRYAERVRDGKADPEGLVDLVQGILTGRDGTER